MQVKYPRIAERSALKLYRERMTPRDKRELQSVGMRINCTRACYRREEIKATLCKSMQTAKIRYTGRRSSRKSKKTQ